MGVAAALLIGFLIFGGGDTNIHITDSTDVTVSVEGAEIPDITATAAPEVSQRERLHAPR